MPFIEQDQGNATCASREHQPPTKAMLKPGFYQWQCPDCLEITGFTVPDNEPTTSYVRRGPPIPRFY